MTNSNSSEALRRARAYVAQHSTAEEKPAFHMTSPTGWFNDPNGFSVYGGKVHLFYQYYPYAPHWDDMHWGHCTTQDFLHWEHLPVALAPDMPYDRGGCFSGSALEVDGRHVLLYTGILADEKSSTRQNQCLAIGDGDDYKKAADNPVIRADQLPGTCNRSDFRDPKLWRDGAFYALVGSRDADDIGQVVLFASDDLHQWHFVSVLAHGRPGMGQMWECPDFFALDGQHVLLVSPQFMKASGREFHNGNGTLALIGQLDTATHQLHAQTEQAIDYGLDFYAPQTVQTPDGRRVMIGWMQSWDNTLTPAGQTWSGIMSIPRELSIEHGRLCQRPVRELDACRGERVAHTRGIQDETVSLDGISGRAFDMELTLDGAGCDAFEIRFAMDEAHFTSLRIHPQTGRITFDRTYSGLCRDVLCERSLWLPPQQDRIALRFVMDRNTVELFVQDGAYALSALVYTAPSATDITFGATGTAAFAVDFYPLAK